MLKTKTLKKEELITKIKSILEEAVSSRADLNRREIESSLSDFSDLDDNLPGEESPYDEFEKYIQSDEYDDDMNHHFNSFDEYEDDGDDYSYWRREREEELPGGIASGPLDDLDLGESAPPGDECERIVHGLKKKYGKSPKTYSIAWSMHNKGICEGPDDKDEEDDADEQQARDREDYDREELDSRKFRTESINENDIAEQIIKNIVREQFSDLGGIGGIPSGKDATKTNGNGVDSVVLRKKPIKKQEEELDEAGRFHQKQAAHSLAIKNAKKNYHHDTESKTEPGIVQRDEDSDVWYDPNDKKN